MGPPAPGSKAQSAVNFFSVWCPKVIAQIGHLPDTLADRCIVFRMQRKIPTEECQRIRSLNTLDLRRQCARFVLDHAQQIASAKPPTPKGLNDRTTDIWEPLFVLADLAGGDWPKLARDAAVGLAASSEEGSLIGSLLLDIVVLFGHLKVDRVFTRTLVDGLNSNFVDRPWMESRKGKPITDLWLSQQLRPYGIKPVNIRLDNIQAKGYRQSDFIEVARRYISKSDLCSLFADLDNGTPDSGSAPSAASS
jgi:hypothetical protein